MRGRRAERRGHGGRADKAEQLARRGIETHLFDGTAPLPATALDGGPHPLHHRARHGGRSGAQDLCTALRDARWLGYLSTTGVYGDHGGDWVDETTPPRPGQPRSVGRLAAERAWQVMGSKRRHRRLFRLPGIYGPGRSAIDQVKAGTARRIDKPDQVFSRIHVEDIAATVLAALTHPSPARSTTLSTICRRRPPR